MTLGLRIGSVGIGWGWFRLSFRSRFSSDLVNVVQGY